MSAILADQQRPRIWAQMRGEGEGSCGSQPMSTGLFTGAQLNFGDLTPDLSYAPAHQWRFSNADSLLTKTASCWTLFFKKTFIKPGTNLWNYQHIHEVLAMGDYFINWWWNKSVLAEFHFLTKNTLRAVMQKFFFALLWHLSLCKVWITVNVKKSLL